MGKRVTPTEEIERMAERIKNSVRRAFDRDQFNKEFNRQLFRSESELSSEQARFRDRVFNHFKRVYPDRAVTQKELKEFRRAKGKDIVSDRQQTRNVVRTKEEYRRRGARHADLPGVDTKPRTESFARLGRERGRIVYARPVTVRIRGKTIRKYRDRRGRFAKV